MASSKEIMEYGRVLGELGLKHEEMQKYEDFNKDMPAKMKGLLRGCGIPLVHLEKSCKTLRSMQRLGALIKAFKLVTFEDLLDLYLKIDVFALRDIFESYRVLSMEHYDLDPARFPSSPALFWQAMLKKTGVRLEMLTDIDMYRFMLGAKRGGLCYITQSRHIANNLGLVPSYDAHDNGYDDGYDYWCNINGYDQKMKTSWLLYLDANNLYGWAMSQLLPIDGFEWVDLDSFDWQTRNWSGKYGAFLEVDLEYPEELHDAHNDFPLAPESLLVRKSMLSQWTHDRFDSVQKSCIDTTKLVPHFYPRERYVVHAELLQFYVRHGMIVKKIHRAVSFRQSAWLKPWVDLNTKLRSRAGLTDFEKGFFKLGNNSVYGKTNENTANHVNAYMIRDKKSFLKKSSQPHYDGFMQLGPNFAIVTMSKRQVILDRPVYVGVAILERSKLLMHGFHYDTMVPRIGRENITMLMTDTDSLIYKIYCEDLNEELMMIIKDLDTSDHPANHVLRACHPEKSANKKIPGKFKDECNGLVLKAWEASGVKNYSLIYGDNIEVKHLKGVSKASVKYLLTYSDWLKQRNADQPLPVQVTRIGAVNHVISTTVGQKMTLYRNDTKRYWFCNGSSLALGHKDCGKEAWVAAPPAKKKRKIVADEDAHRLDQH